MTLRCANIAWRADASGALMPYSIDFNDIYYSADDGLLETEYVFIDKNNLKQRFTDLIQPFFCVAETGFGTGLNFFAVATHWLNLAPKSAVLRYIGFEKYPLAQADFSKIVQNNPQFQIIADELLANYQHLKTGFNCFKMANNRIELHLYIDDITNVLPNIQIKDNSWVNAWLLDGFAPAKNPAMWDINMFKHIARISSGHSTFATFTSAGFVRRNLQGAGFTVEKHKGFGKKRDMLAGYFAGH